MPRLELHYAHGQPSYLTETLDDAIRILKGQYGANIVLSAEWEPSKIDLTRERKLVWPTQADANNGSDHAVAQVIRRRSVPETTNAP